MTKLIVSVLGLAVAGGIFFMYTKKTFDTIRALNAEITQYDDALIKTAELEKRKAELLDKQKAFDSNDLNRLEKLLPDHVDNVRLILDLDNLALAHQMPMQNVSIGDPRKDVATAGVIDSPDPIRQKVGSLTLNFATSGTYEQFKSFLSDLEASLRIVDVTGLQIDRSSSSRLGGTPTYTFTISTRTYWLK